VSVQLVGVYLVFANLIVPAIAARRCNGHHGLWPGYLLGAIGYALGPLLSLVCDMPPGALIVCCLLACNPYKTRLPPICSAGYLADG
jgi:zinc/manganese transport system permease protein